MTIDGKEEEHVGLRAKPTCKGTKNREINLGFPLA
jgi:hypothetical protein